MTRRSGVAAAATALALVLASCSGADESPAGDPAGGSDPTSTSEGASETATESATESAPTAEPTPEVMPATGAVLRVKGMRVNAPKRWLTSIRVAAGQTAFPSGQVGTIIGVNRFPNSGLFTIEEIADEQVSRMGKGRKRLDDRFIDGLQVYHLVGSPEPGVDAERFGTITLDQRVALEFRFANRESRAEKDEIIQCVLATMQLG